MRRAKVGDLAEVLLKPGQGKSPLVGYGVIVGFNEKSEGGKDFVHVYIDGKYEVFLAYEIKLL